MVLSQVHDNTCAVWRAAILSIVPKYHTGSHALNNGSFQEHVPYDAWFEASTQHANVVVITGRHLICSKFHAVWKVNLLLVKPPLCPLLRPFLSFTFFSCGIPYCCVYHCKKLRLHHGKTGLGINTIQDLRGLQVSNILKVGQNLSTLYNPCTQKRTFARNDRSQRDSSFPLSRCCVCIMGLFVYVHMTFVCHDLTTTCFRILLFHIIWIVDLRHSFFSPSYNLSNKCGQQKILTLLIWYAFHMEHHWNVWLPTFAGYDNHAMGSGKFRPVWLDTWYPEDRPTNKKKIFILWRISFRKMCHTEPLSHSEGKQVKLIGARKCWACWRNEHRVVKILILHGHGDATLQWFNFAAKLRTRNILALECNSAHQRWPAKHGKTKRSLPPPWHAYCDIHIWIIWQCCLNIAWVFFRRSLCAVLVFGCVLPSASLVLLLLPPSLLTQQLTHTPSTHTHNLLTHQLLPHHLPTHTHTHNLLTRNLPTHHLPTHHLTTYNLLTHQLLTHHLPTHNSPTHHLHTYNLLTYNLLTYDLSTQLTHTQTHTHTNTTYTHTHNLHTQLIAHTQLTHTPLTHTTYPHTHTTHPHTTYPHTHTQLTHTPLTYTPFTHIQLTRQLLTHHLPTHTHNSPTHHLHTYNLLTYNLTTHNLHTTYTHTHHLHTHTHTTYTHTHKQLPHTHTHTHT